jgi:hypothetical protein
MIRDICFKNNTIEVNKEQQVDCEIVFRENGLRKANFYLDRERVIELIKDLAEVVCWNNKNYPYSRKEK